MPSLENTYPYAYFGCFCGISESVAPMVTPMPTKIWRKGVNNMCFIGYGLFLLKMALVKSESHTVEYKSK